MRAAIENLYNPGGEQLGNDATIIFNYPPDVTFAMLSLAPSHTDIRIGKRARIRTHVCARGACGANKTLQGKRTDAINFSRAIEGVAAAPPSSPFAPSSLLSIAFPTNKYLQASETSCDT